MKIITLSAFLMISSFSFSQIKITGKIINQDSKPVEFAEILLLNKDSVAIKSELTDQNGFFSIDTKQGSYIFQIKQFKEIIYARNIEVLSHLDLGTIKAENTTNLQEVIIQEKKKLIERKIDRLIFNVENSIAATGGDALDALRVTPSIRVQNDQISMVGKSGMAVMIDDKLMQLSGN